MSDILNTLLDSNAFVPSPLADDLLACHVPFDDLIEGAAVESELEERVRRGRAIALIGESGSGKSGVSTYVLGRITTEFAPIRTPVFYETEKTVTDPGGFARYLLQRLLGEAEAIEALTGSEREQMLREASERLQTPTRTIGHHVGGGLELPWMLKAEAARDVSTTIGGGDLEGSTATVLQIVDRVIEVLFHNGLVPIIVLDDTDRWLQVGDVDRSDLVGGFFGGIVRMLAERGAALVVAVHSTYLDMDEYVVGTRGFLTEAIRLPRLPSSDALTRVLAHRIALQIPDVSSVEVLGDAAVEKLFHYYDTVWNGSMRWTLQAAHEALTAACATSADQIAPAMIDDAAAGYES